MRRGFTLLETVLAASIGCVVALAALGLFLSIDKTDAMLAARYRQSTALERAHKVMSRAFLSLVTSDKPRPPQQRAGVTGAGGASSAAKGAAGNGPAAPLPGRPGAPSAGTGPTPGAGGATPGTAGASAEESSKTQGPPPPPRMRLMLDPLMAGRRMSRPGVSAMSAPVQMFEVVVHTSPVGQVNPRNAQLLEAIEQAREEKPVAEREDDKDGTRRDAPRLLSPTGKVYRGAFVLRPAGESSGARVSDAEPWSLWWQPLPPARDDGLEPGAVEVALAGTPVELATDIAYMRWQVFDDRVRKPEFSAVWRSDIPAYIELELVTTAGLAVNWMFEVDFLDGSEGSGSTSTDGAAPAGAPADGTGSPSAGAPFNKITTIKPKK